MYSYEFLRESRSFLLFFVFGGWIKYRWLFYYRFFGNLLDVRNNVIEKYLFGLLLLN